MVKSSDDAWYKCVGGGSTIVGGKPVAREWRKATDFEVDTYSLSATATVGTYVAGPVNDNLHYVMESYGWRPATDLEKDSLKACTSEQQNIVKQSSVKTKENWYKCTNENPVTIDTFKVAYTWRKATNIEKDTVGWGRNDADEGDVKPGEINGNLVYVFETKNGIGAWRHGTSLDATLDQSCIPSRKDTLLKFSSVEWYKCVGDTNVSYEESNWTSVWRRATDLEVDMYYWNQNATEDGALLKGSFTGLIRVWDNGSLREPNEVELGWNKGCVKSMYDKKYILSNGLEYTCSSTGWSKTGTFDDCREVDANYDCKVYKGVKIGTQTWMAENLSYKAKNSFCYNDDESNCTKYGRLYRWSAAMDSAGTYWPTHSLNGCGYNKTCSVTLPVEGACPHGWHLPIVEEFETLAATVGDVKKLRSATGWSGSGANGTDDYAFSALPAGYLDSYSDEDGYGLYYGEGTAARFLTANEKDKYNAQHLELESSYGSATFYIGSKNKGYSIRCVKDN